MQTAGQVKPQTPAGMSAQHSSQHNTACQDRGPLVLQHAHVPVCISSLIWYRQVSLSCQHVCIKGLSAHASPPQEMLAFSPAVLLGCCHRPHLPWLQRSKTNCKRYYNVLVDSRCECQVVHTKSNPDCPRNGYLQQQHAHRRNCTHVTLRSWTPTHAMIWRVSFAQKCDTTALAQDALFTGLTRATRCSLRHTSK